MRTTLVEIHLFNDDFSLLSTSFIRNGKGWAESKLVERQRESEMEHCYERVAAWVINLTFGQVFMTA